MKTIITMAMLLMWQLAFPQQAVLDSMARELNKLIFSKIHYDQFKTFAEWNSSTTRRYVAKRDSCYEIYIAQVKKIKSKHARYLEYINTEIQKPKLAEKRVDYTYVDRSLPYDRNEYAISLLDLYRVIKYCLLEQDADVLPERLDDVPIPIKRDHYEPFKLQTIEDIVPDPPTHTDSD